MDWKKSLDYYLTTDPNDRYDAEAELVDEGADALSDIRADMLMEQMCSDCQQNRDICCDCHEFDHYISPDLPNPLEDI
jgi:hypothetical protein